MRELSGPKITGDIRIHKNDDANFILVLSEMLRGKFAKMDRGETYYIIRDSEGLPIVREFIRMIDKDNIYSYQKNFTLTQLYSIITQSKECTVFLDEPGMF